MGVGYKLPIVQLKSVCKRGMHGACYESVRSRAMVEASVGLDASSGTEDLARAGLVAASRVFHATRPVNAGSS